MHYWNNHTNPVAGIVYDEQQQEAFWVNISEYLSLHPEVLDQTSHTIRVSPNAIFSDFPLFKRHFTEYIQEYKGYENFGRSLDNFAQVDDPHICYDGFKSLYVNHRNRTSAWFYIISNFGKIKETGIHGNMLGIMSNYIPSDDILWTPKSVEFLYKTDIKEKISKFLTVVFGPKEVSIAIEFMREGVVRGSYSYIVYKVLTLIENIHKILLEITYSEPEPERRDFDFWLYIHFSQWDSTETTISEIDKYLDRFPNSDPDQTLHGMREDLLEGNRLYIG